MLNLPQTTDFNKRIPKQKFYENLTITPALKRLFTEQIKLIYWRNKIAASTTNLAPGKTVTEVEVMELRLTGDTLDEAVLRQIDREIPYHIIFLLEYKGKYQARIGYKEAAAGKNAFTVGRYYCTEWMTYDELPISFSGLDMDEVWQNLIMQISGTQLSGGRDLGEQIAVDERKAAIRKQIEKLEAKTRKEIQPKKKFELYQQVQALKKQLEEIE